MIKNVKEFIFRNLAVVFLYFSLISSANAQPAQFTGNDFFEYCGKSELSSLKGYCMGYLQGMASLLGSSYVTKSAKICMPSTVTLYQSVDIVLAELRRHPEGRHLSAGDIIAIVLQRNFPCAK